MGTEERRAVRGAVYQGDGDAVVAALSGLDLDRSLQVGGSALLVALDDGAAGAGELVGRVVAGLRERGWKGDEELAVELDVARGVAEPTGLTGLPVNLEELSELIESGDLGGGAVNLHSGEVWRTMSFDFFEDAGMESPDLDDPDEWLLVDGSGSQQGYRDMEFFIATVEDPTIADRLAIAIEGKGTFRRFRALLERYEEVEGSWYRFSEERRWGRARSWLAEIGCRPVPRQRFTAR